MQRLNLWIVAFGTAALAGGALSLDDPEETLVALAPLLGGPGFDLVVLSPRGLAAHLARPLPLTRVTAATVPPDTSRRRR